MIEAKFEDAFSPQWEKNLTAPSNELVILRQVIPWQGIITRLVPFYKPTVSPLMIPLVYGHINSFQRAASVEKPWPGGENRRGGRAAHPVEW
jgi:hypothetical protein